MRRADSGSRSGSRIAALAAATARRFARAAAVVRRVIGAPDYERYAARAAACGCERVMTRQEFTEGRLAARYDRPGSRCC